MRGNSFGTGRRVAFDKASSCFFAWGLVKLHRLAWGGNKKPDQLFTGHMHFTWTVPTEIELGGAQLRERKEHGQRWTEVESCLWCSGVVPQPPPPPNKWTWLLLLLLLSAACSGPISLDLTSASLPIPLNTILFTFFFFFSASQSWYLHVSTHGMKGPPYTMVAFNRYTAWSASCLCLGVDHEEGGMRRKALLLACTCFRSTAKGRCCCCTVVRCGV